MTQAADLEISTKHDSVGSWISYMYSTHRNSEYEKVKMTNNNKKWFGRSAWVYADEDGDFLPMLLKTMKGHFQSYVQWQSNIHLDEYPQYLCSAKIGGSKDDVVHLWRDGQTWWPILGKFNIKKTDNVELILRKCINDYANNQTRGTCREQGGTLFQVKPHLAALEKGKRVVIYARSWLL